MKLETRREQFQAPTLIGRILTRLHIDIPLFIGLLLISGLSFVVLYSAGNQQLDLLLRQAARVSLAFVLMAALAYINPYQFRRYAILLFAFGVILLVAVFAIGYTGKGATRWLDLGVLRFQPSEMLKLTTPMMISCYLADHALPPKPIQLLVAGVLILIPTLLIAKQPDLGTAILVAASGGAVLFFAGMSWRFILAILAGIAGLAPILWNYALHDYQRARIITLLDPEADL